MLQSQRSCLLAASATASSCCPFAAAGRLYSRPWTILMPGSLQNYSRKTLFSMTVLCSMIALQNYNMTTLSRCHLPAKACANLLIHEWQDGIKLCMLLAMPIHLLQLCDVMHSTGIGCMNHLGSSKSQHEDVTVCTTPMIPQFKPERTAYSIKLTLSCHA